MEKSLWVWQLCDDTYEFFEIRVKEAPILVRTSRGALIPDSALVIVSGGDRLKASPNIYDTEAEAKRSMLYMLKGSLSDARNKAAICLGTSKDWAARADSYEEQLKNFERDIVGNKHKDAKSHER